MPPVPEPAPAEASRDYLDIRAALAASGLSFPAARRVTGLGEALAFAEEHGYPVVLKALGDEHKSDRGGVKLFIDSEHALARAWNEIRSALDPAACSVERMVTQPHAVELIVGSRWDPRFGPMTLVGLGGIYAEVFRDVRVALGPVDLTRAREMLRSLRGSALLSGVRGNPPVDLDAASAAVRDLSRFAASHPEFAEVECNPIQVSPDGAIALDARAVWASAQHTERQRGNG
ncbi:acetate--CoA ligase family protein [Leucobacter sp. M11]|uniref:acetate--CoA ligase family protein n=1 Tax=Leucobacter sp. M11 TaxID=2993565 RepID=UPI002D7EF1A1|nr:acetate--CoA ligase family protein [Leucobacter sp. M11]MEB4616538.1 acetate--CoA ligase family protein [Leucobacter sp. M11]